MRGFWGILLLIAVAPAALGKPVHNDPASKEMRAAFEEGTTDYNLGHFEDALAAFERGYRVKNDPAFLFNIGQCQRQLAAAQGRGAQLSRVPARVAVGAGGAGDRGAAAHRAHGRRGRARGGERAADRREPAGATPPVATPPVTAPPPQPDRRDAAAAATQEAHGAVDRHRRRRRRGRGRARHRARRRAVAVGRQRADASLGNVSVSFK